MHEDGEKLNVVYFGGGTGLPTGLEALKRLKTRKRKRRPVSLNITAVVTMFDSGGSSGLLRDEYYVLPSGDLLRCMIALSRLPVEQLRILVKRIEIGGVKHTLANLFLAQVEKLTGWRSENYELVLKALADFMEVEGTVLPVSTQGNIVSDTGANMGSSHLCAEFSDEFQLKGETSIDEEMNRGRVIKRLWLEPPVAASASVIRAIENAHYIFMGPGSLYTSVVASILPGGVKLAFRKNLKAKIGLVTNVMREGGGMESMMAGSHVRIVEEYAGRPLDHIIINTAMPSGEVLEAYEAQNKKPLLIEPELRHDPRCHFARLWFMPADRRIAEDPKSIRHDARRLAVMLGRIMNL